MDKSQNELLLCIAARVRLDHDASKDGYQYSFSTFLDLGEAVTTECVHANNRKLLFNHSSSVGQKNLINSTFSEWLLQL